MTDDQHPANQSPRRQGGAEGGQTGPSHAVSEVVSALREQVSSLERLVGPELRAVEGAGGFLRPAWQRATAGENRLPVAAVIALAIALQLLLPARFQFNPVWLLPVLESVLLVGLVAANPRRIDRSSRALRLASLTLIAIISLGNAWSVAQLIRTLVHGGESDAIVLLGSGAAVYITNIIVFGLWFWEFDRGGPAARAQGLRPYPDFLFPQMENRELTPSSWEPTFPDYLWLAYTNVTAFSPTDIMPLSRWAKQLMMLQSAVAVVTVALVIARAVNILK